jgi:hypothetical protein
MKMSINWDLPIEAVHEDGRVMGVTFEGLSAAGNQLISPPLDGVRNVFDEDGAQTYGTGWRIRNVQPATPPSERPSDEVVERMVAVIKLMAITSDGRGSEYAEARHIAALLPQPVDQDLIAAREYHEAWLDERYEDLDHAICAAIKHGREQERKA